MEFLMGLFAGMVWYELLFICGGAFLFLGLAASESYAGVLVLIALIAGLQWDSLIDVRQLTFMGVLYSFIGYFLAGTIWSFVKWYRYVRAKRVYWLEKSARAEKNGDKIREWEAPEIKDKLDDIVLWILYWPISIIVYFSSDFLVRTAKNIVAAFGKVYDKITDIASR
jgi:hypothetical protein